MPLVRFEVRNEYGLADPDLYNGRHEDPRPVFEGLAVAGLVGILRQLGDLAEFAADIFRDLHEQVMITGERGQQILSRLQKIESALLPLEKAVQNQSSHIHFAYVAGCDWHPDVRTGQSRLICSELPKYMIDSYDECRDPPRLYLLDNFDNAGPGACLRRYSDPSYFRRALTASEPVKPEKVKRRKKKGSRLRSRDVHQVLTPRESSSTQFESPSTNQLSFSVENISITDGRPKSEFERESTSFDSETRVNFEDTNTSFMVHDEQEYNLSTIPTSIINPSDVCVPVLHYEPIEDTADVDSEHGSLQQQSIPSSCSVTWVEKTEIVKPESPKMCEEVLVDRVEDAESLPLSFKTSNLVHQNAQLEENSQEYIVFDIENLPVLLSGGTHFVEVISETENYMDANNILESKIEMDGECQTKQEVKSLQNLNCGDLKPELSELEGRTISSLDGFDGLDPVASCSSTNDYIFPRLSNFIILECLEHDQSICTADFAPKHDSVGSDYSRNHISNVSGVNGSKGLNDDLFQEVKSLSNLSYADSKPELSELEGTVSSLDGFDGLSPAASCSSTNDYISPTVSNFIPLEGLEHDQSICTTGFATNHDSVGSDHSGNHISNVSGVNGSDVLDDDLFQEVKSLPNFNYADLKPELSELEGKTLSSFDDFDGLAPAATCSSTKGSLLPSLSNLIPSEDLERDQSICTSAFSPKHDFVASDHSESHISNVSRVNGSKDLNDDMSPESNTVNEHLELVEDTKAKIINPAAASLQVSSLNCWTNGGIFGVEPSKPPDFSILHDTVATSETLVISREIMFAEESAKSHPVKQNSQESSQGPLGENVKNGEVPTHGTYVHNHGLDKKETKATALGSNLLRCATIGTIGSQFNSCDKSVSASISNLTQRFLANNLPRRISVNHTDISTMSHLVNADFRKSREISLQNEHHALSNGVLSRVSNGLDKERIVGSSVHSLSASSPKTGSSSPPLEHMKISFHPMNGLQASKLKLEFCGNVHESNGDQTFPLFQLIPGPSTASLDSGSESDDDTFCRSSYSSQCLFSPHSESNSELWGEDERSGTREDAISDNSCRLSSSISICSSLEFEKMDRCRIYPSPESENLELESALVPTDSDPTRDLPGIDSVIFTKKQQQEICDSLTNDPMDSKPLSPNELPLPPPLPPMQWQVVQPSSSLEDKNSSGDQLDAHTQRSVTLEQQEQDTTPRWPCNAEGVAPPKKKTHDQQNLNGHRELSSSCSSEEPDEREDLLQQIRSKPSSNLRPTVTLQLNQTPGPATSFNVVAILEKADVIHQAFVSNNKGREDDNRSKG